MNNHDEHKNRTGKYNPQTVEEALDIIYGLQPSNFNNYAQMVKDIKLICRRVKDEQKRSIKA